MAMPKMGFASSNSRGFIMLLGVALFFLIMIARKQLDDFFGFELNLLYTFIGALIYAPITFFFGLYWGAIAGIGGATIGAIAGAMFGGGGEY